MTIQNSECRGCYCTTHNPLGLFEYYQLALHDRNELKKLRQETV